MIDPILSLSFSVHSKKGVYALMLGSGVSRAAEIPTGWEVVLDLVRKLAHLQGEDPEPEPVAWYGERFGTSPNYSDLLDQLAKTPAERNQLLRNYFEPTEDERERGAKVPTKAYKAIAELVANGYVRVIVTTNFDRLLEKALEAAGITPTIISTPESMEGTLPLQHNACSIIKLHGDYLDTRIKNTPQELAEYDEPINRLLDRVFDEYGLIVCGWSADYDTALRAALERSKSHRFTMYWASRGSLGEAAKKMVSLRRAQVIPIRDADTFFADLAEKVSALDEYSRPHPLSTQLAVATLKKHLTDGNKIRLHDLMMAEAGKLHREFHEEQVPHRLTSIGSGDPVREVRRCEALSEILVAMMVTGCYWGDRSHEDLWARCLERLAIIPGQDQGVITRPHFGLYPALLLLYAGGLASVASGNYSTFYALLTRAKVRQLHENQPLVLVVHPVVVVDSRDAQQLPGMERHYTPLNDHLYDVLREPLKDFLPEEMRYGRCFDRFEYLLALVYADIYEKQGHHVWGPVGRFGWRDRGYPENHISTEIESEATAMGEDWSPLKVGLFDGSVERFLAIKKTYDERISGLDWGWPW